MGPTAAMTIRRTKAFAFMDEPIDSNNKAICHHCYDLGIKSYLQTYYMKDGRVDPKLRQCPYCKAIIRTSQMKRESVIMPLGSVSGINESSFESVVSRRRVRQNRDRDVFNYQDYPLAKGIPDNDLRYFANQGIITCITDSGDQEE